MAAWPLEGGPRQVQTITGEESGATADAGLETPAHPMCAPVTRRGGCVLERGTPRESLHDVKRKLSLSQAALSLSLSLSLSLPPSLSRSLPPSHAYPTMRASADRQSGEGAGFRDGADGCG